MLYQLSYSHHAKTSAKGSQRSGLSQTCGGAVNFERVLRAWRKSAQLSQANKKYRFQIVESRHCRLALEFSIGAMLALLPAHI